MTDNIQKYNRNEQLTKSLIDIAETFGLNINEKISVRLVWFVNNYAPNVSAQQLFKQAMDYSWQGGEIRGITLSSQIITAILKQITNKELSIKQKEGNLDVKEANGYILSLLGLSASSVDTEGLFEYFKNRYGYSPSKVVMIIKSYIVKPDKERYYGKRDIQYFTMIVNEYYMENDNKINYSK